MKRIRLTVLLLMVALVPPTVWAAGPRTHAEMGQRAWDQYILTVPDMQPGLADIRADEDAMRAFYSGCTFPDFGYNGINDEAAEYSHWYPYQIAYFEHLKERLQLPLDAPARREFAFFLGVLCHGVGDTPWHFDEDGHKSLLTMAREQDNSGHGFTEHVTDIFSHVLFELDPDPRGNFVWMQRTARDVFEKTGTAVTPEEIARGCRKQEADWMRGARLGPVAYPYFQAKIPWCRKHYVDYYFGGCDHGAALTAMCIRYYFARLNGWHYYQNIPLQSCAFPKGEPYTPCTDETLAADSDRPESGILAVGDLPWATLRFNLSDIEDSETINQATLWLHRLDDPWSGTVEVAVHALNGTGAAGHDPSPIAVQCIAGATPSWVAWDVTALVRQWGRGLRPNHGLLLKTGAPEGNRSTAPVRFYSSTALKARPDGYGGTVVAFRPILIVR